MLGRLTPVEVTSPDTPWTPPRLHAAWTSPPLTRSPQPAALRTTRGRRYDMSEVSRADVPTAA